MTRVELKSRNPEKLDELLTSSFGAALEQNADGSYRQTEAGGYICRSFGDAGYLMFAIRSQGYTEVVGEIVDPGQDDMSAPEVDSA